MDSSSSERCHWTAITCWNGEGILKLGLGTQPEKLRLMPEKRNRQKGNGKGRGVINRSLGYGCVRVVCTLNHFRTSRNVVCQVS